MSKKKSPKAASIAEWDALLARYPLGSPWEMARQFLSVAGSNAVVFLPLIASKARAEEAGGVDSEKVATSS